MPPSQLMSSVYLTIFLLTGAHALVSHKFTSTANDIRRDRQNRPKDALWFGSFSASESTYNDDMDGTYPTSQITKHVDGWGPSVAGPYAGRNAVPTEWFHESPSAADLQAWQTHYPSLETGIGGHSAVVGKWRRNAGGSWVQDFVPADNHESSQQGPLSADWFDANVNNYDGFGRQNSPSVASARRFALWEERAVNTSLTCKDPGCNASVSLQIFNGEEDRARHCKFSFFVHPTDFDNTWSPEPIQFIRINGVQVKSSCNVERDGCNATSWRPLYPCVQDLDISQLMFQTGTLTVSAGISEYVDECPYEGNLLSAVPIVTCLVEPQQLPPLYGTAPGGVYYPEVPASVQVITPTWQSYISPLKCKDRGCTATTIVDVNATWVLQDHVTCRLDVHVNQTDFDNEQGTVEKISYIAVQGDPVRENILPGSNPCVAKWGDDTRPLTPAEKDVLALEGYDVTAIAREGNFQVSGAISEFVDECPSQGYMFDALAIVNCSQLQSG